METEQRYLTIALTKGRLASKTMSILEPVSYTQLRAHETLSDLV